MYTLNQQWYYGAITFCVICMSVCVCDVYGCLSVPDVHHRNDTAIFSIHSTNRPIVVYALSHPLSIVYCNCIFFPNVAMTEKS